MKRAASEECRTKRKITVLTLCALLFALYGAANAQQSGKIFRLGFLDIALRPVARSL